MGWTCAFWKAEKHCVPPEYQDVLVTGCPDPQHPLEQPG